MTLRDYFAAKALQPLIDEMISRKANIEGFDEAACVEAVRLSFITADAMLKSRTEPKGGSEMSKPETIKIDEVEYVRKDSVSQKEYSGDVKIVILQRGWVYVGNFKQLENMMCELNGASCIRSWGTTKGLAELKDGPLSSTKLDYAGKVTFHLLTSIAMIDCDGDAWSKYCK